MSSWLILGLSDPAAPLWLFLLCLSLLVLVYYLLSFELQNRCWLSEIPLAVGLGMGMGAALGWNMDSGDMKIWIKAGTAIAIAVQVRSTKANKRMQW